MYVPARSDLIAATLAAAMSAALTVVAAMALPLEVRALALLGVLVTPSFAALLSGPGHSMTSRFLFRGLAAIPGMAAVVASHVLIRELEEPIPTRLAGTLLLSMACALSALVYLLIVNTLIRLRVRRTAASL